MRETVNIFRYLSNVNIAAVLVDLRVVLIQDGVVDASGSRDNVAVIVGLNCVSSGAVLSLPSKAVGVARNEVVARVVNNSVVDDCELVATEGGNVSGKASTGDENKHTWKRCWLPRCCRRYHHPEQCKCECMCLQKQLHKRIECK